MRPRQAIRRNRLQLQKLRKSAAEKLVNDAQTRARRAMSAPLEERLAAIENLGLDTFANQREVLQDLCRRKSRRRFMRPCSKHARGFDSPDVAGMVLAQWEHLTPDERSQATELLLRRKAWALALLQYLSSEGCAAHDARSESFDPARELSGG